MTPREQLLAWKAEGRITITPTELAKVLGGQPYSYNISAKSGRLGLPHVWAGTHLKIFLAGVLEACGVKD